MEPTWKDASRDFGIFLRLEKSLSANSIEAYHNDISKLEQFFLETGKETGPADVSYPDLKEFLAWFNKLSHNARTQSRVLSGIRAFYKYLLLEGTISREPCVTN